MTKHFYAAYNSFGVNCSYDGDGWQVNKFTLKTTRDKWVNSVNQKAQERGQVVAEIVDSKTAKKILDGDAPYVME